MSRIPPIPAAFIDLDNCISEDAWRWHMFDLHHPVVHDRYKRYHDACHLDLHKNEAVVRDLASRYALIIATARPEEVRVRTTMWLQQHRIRIAGLYMRPNYDDSGSVELKRLMLERARERGFKIEHAIDDRLDVLDMYADNGVAQVRRVFIHLPEHTHP